MDKKIYPHPSILQALQSESDTATPFSRIPGFIKKYALVVENKTKLISLLSSLGDKEITHLDTRVAKVQNDITLFDPELYKKIVHTEGGKDKEGRAIYPKLIGLAKEIIASEMGAPAYQILKQMEAKLGTGAIDPSTFDNPHKDISEQFSDKEKNLVQQEQQVRIIMNALIMGAGHRIFDKVEADPKYPKSINKICPDLYQAYYDMVYTNLKYMWETQPASPSGTNTGSMQLITENNETKIKIQADIFPVLLHEMAKGVVEYIAYARYNTMRSEITQSILSVDSRASEHRMMLIGPQIYKQLFFLIKEALAQYSEKKGMLASKQESDYIIPILSHIIQLPVDQFLTFIENILREDQDGAASIASITSIIDAIHRQYDSYLATHNAPKMQLTVKEIMQQLTLELSLGKKEQLYIKTALPEVKVRLEAQGYTMSDKKLAKKIAEYYMGHRKKFQLSDMVDQSWLMEVDDALQGFKKSRIEQAAFAHIHEQQKKFPKWTRNHEKQSINIHPRFPLAALEEAKKNLHPQVLEDIDNQIKELIQNGSISDWFKDHDEMSTKNSQLTERFITLDDVTPECLMEREGNWGLYELVNLEQLKREAGSMGGHCVPDFINSIKNGALRVFSLRLGTQSRRTIGYQPSIQTINQVKGYTNKKKNALLTENDPDYQQVFQALKYMTKYVKVKQINDIDSAGFIVTNQGLFLFDEFINRIKGLGEEQQREIYSKNVPTIPLSRSLGLETLHKTSKIKGLKLQISNEIECITQNIKIFYDTTTQELTIGSDTDRDIIINEKDALLKEIQTIIKTIHVKQIDGIEDIRNGNFVYTTKGLLSKKEFARTIKKLKPKQDAEPFEVLNPNSIVKLPIDAINRFIPAKNISKVLFYEGYFLLTFDVKEGSIESIRSSYYHECGYTRIDEKNTLLSFENKEYPRIIQFLNICLQRGVKNIGDMNHLYETGKIILTTKGLLSSQELIDDVDDESVSVRSQGEIFVPEKTDISVISKLLKKHDRNTYLLKKGDITIAYRDGTIQKITSSHGNMCGKLHNNKLARKIIKYRLDHIPVYHILEDTYFIRTNNGRVEPEHVIQAVNNQEKISLPQKHEKMYASLEMDTLMLQNLCEVASSLLFPVGRGSPFIVAYDVEKKSIESVLPTENKIQTSSYRNNFFHQEKVIDALHRDHPLYEAVIAAIVAITKKLPVTSVPYQMSDNFKEKGLILTNLGFITGDHYQQLLEERNEDIKNLNHTEYAHKYYGVSEVIILHKNVLITPGQGISGDVVEKLCKEKGIELDLTHVAQNIKDKIRRIDGSLLDFSTVVQYPVLEEICGFCNVSCAIDLCMGRLQIIGGAFSHYPSHYMKTLDLSSLEKFNYKSKEPQQYLGPKTTKNLLSILKKVKGADTIPVLDSKKNSAIFIESYDLPF